MAKSRSDGRTGRRRGSLAWWMLFSTALFVAVSNSEEKPLRKVELLLLESHKASIMTVGLHIQLAPSWHLYWINPGDAGLAPEITWNLPPGYEAGPLRFPTPEKFVHSDIVAYGFKSEVLILCEIRPSGPLTATEMPTIACQLDWMACQESCITGREAIKVSPATQTPADLKRSRKILSRFARRFPKPLDTARISLKEAGFVKSRNGWQVEIPLMGKGGGLVSDFYPYPIENFVVAHNRIARSGGKVIIPLEPSGPSAVLVRIDGLLILGDDAYEV
ncbi:MAG TPA: protein-disulfide reductase DsbD domain-containing protein, partial [Candidatus Desulfaltia sp.]|nr:protein-disulfide reductase DsbD domain-containing protein [Candidatus Desulfaltia sp.]